MPRYPNCETCSIILSSIANLHQTGDCLHFVLLVEFIMLADLVKSEKLTLVVVFVFRDNCDVVGITYYANSFVVNPEP